MNRCLLTCLVLCFAVTSYGAKRQASFFTTNSDQVVPLVIVGEGWSQGIIIQNVDATDASVGTLSFFTRDGAPWQVSLVDRGRASVFLVNMKSKEAAIYETVVSQATQQLGWAVLSLGSQGRGEILGQAIFRKQTVGFPDFMTGHILGDQAYTRLATFFDNTGGKYTGMEILNTGTCYATTCNDSLRVTVADLSGAIISQKVIQQKRNTLQWMNLGVDFPETNGRIGTFVVEPVSSYSTGVTGFSLQFAPNGAFTAITPFED